MSHDPSRALTILIASTCSFALSTLMSRPALAAFDNYNSVLIGERAAGMGGAFTALTGDPAATPFYNPATTVLLAGSSLSATVNVYNKYETTLGESGDFLSAPQRVNRGFFRSLPSASGTILNFKSFAAGISILVPDYDFYSGQVKGTENTFSSLSTIDESLWVGGTFSGKLTEQDAIGLTIYYTARNLTRSVSDKVTAADGSGATLMDEEKNLTSNSIVSILGYHRRLSPRWSAGISYRTPALPISGEASFYRSITQTTPYSSTVINRGNLRAVSEIPSLVRIGLAREVPGENTISFDLQIHEGIEYRDLPEFESGADAVAYRRLVNFAVGYEQVVRDWVKLRLGGFTNLSAHPGPDLSKNARQGDQVDMAGFSANVSLQTKDNTSFTFGGYYNGGSGTTTQLVGGQLRLVPKSQQVFTMLISTGFYF